MPYLTTFERFAIKKTQKKAIQRFLTFRFGAAAGPILTEILALEDHEVLDKVLDAIETVENPEQLRPLWTPESSAPSQSGPATNA